MNYTQIFKSTFTALVLGCFCASTMFGQSQSTYQDTLKLLSKMNDRISTRDVLAKLFRVGDGRIDDLLRALDESNPDISLRAQVVIRYLGNEAGMKGLFEWYAKQKRFRVTGPIPLPLREYDYKVIYAQYIGKPHEDWTRAEPYIYALALDDSPKAREVLKELIKSAVNFDEPTLVRRAIKTVQANQPTKLLIGEQDLAQLVLSNAFFILPDDQKYASAHLLSLNGAKDKALVEVYINRGPLSEEWYHVVLRKCEQGWRLFSITPVAMS